MTGDLTLVAGISDVRVRPSTRVLSPPLQQDSFVFIRNEGGLGSRRSPGRKFYTHGHHTFREGTVA